MTLVRGEDVDFSKGQLHVSAINAKFNKTRTVVLLLQVAEAISKQLAGHCHSKGWLVRSRKHPYNNACWCDSGLMKVSI